MVGATQHHGMGWGMITFLALAHMVAGMQHHGMGWGGCFSFEGTVQYIEESNIYLCFVVCRLKRGLVT